VQSEALKRSGANQDPALVCPAAGSVLAAQHMDDYLVFVERHPVDAPLAQSTLQNRLRPQRSGTGLEDPDADRLVAHGINNARLWSLPAA
jgi:hypothetical protein